MADTLTDKGIGSMLNGTFTADLAQFHEGRIDQVILENKSSEFRNAENEFRKYVANFLKENNVTSNQFTVHTDDIMHELVYLAKKLGYRAGYQDGIKTVVSSLIG